MNEAGLPANAVEELVDACRVLAAEGHEDKALGHLSMRDPDGRGFWLKRAGIGLSEVRTGDDFVLLGFDGTYLAGTGKQHIEWPIHAEVMVQRPDVDFVFHSHPRHSVLFSALDEPLPLVGNESVFFVDGVPRYTDTSDLIRTSELGRDVASTLGTGAVALLRHHGIVVARPSLSELVLTAIYLEATARNALDLFATGRPFVPIAPDDARAKATRTVSPSVVEDCWSFFRRALRRSEEQAGGA